MQNKKPNQYSNNRKFSGGGKNNRPPRQPYSPDIAREAAAKLVWQVLDENRTLDEAMINEATFANLTGKDRGFASAVAKATIRHFGHIELLIAEVLSKPLPETAFYARALLRIGVGQYLADIAPAHAIVGRAVDLAKANKVARGMSGLINAVLRKIVTQETKPHLDPLELLPFEWRKRYQSYYGDEITNKIAQSILTPSPIDFTILRNFEAAREELGGTEISPISQRLVDFPKSLTEIQAWQNGDIIIQNSAAALPATLLDAKEGMDIADICAAPGGKTVQLANNGANVTAIDISPNRIKLIKENLSRTHLEAQIIDGDARNILDDNKYDAILLDAPCSATGTLRSNLETMWIKSPIIIPQLLEIQSELLTAAAKALKIGGKLLFAICSLEPEEAENAMQTAANLGLGLDEIKAQEAQHLKEAILPNGTMRIMPYHALEKGGMDGFFIARFVKK